MPQKKKRGPKQVTVHGVTYKRSSGVDTAMIQRYKEKIAKEVRGKKGERTPEQKQNLSPRSGGKGAVHVRAHARRGTRGVKAHTRKR